MKTPIIIIGMIVIVSLLFVNGGFEFGQKDFDESIQNIPPNIQDASKTAQDFALETTTIIRETISEQLEGVQIDPTDISVKDISEIPKNIQEKNLRDGQPLIDKTHLEKLIHQRTNQYREQNHLNPLFLDDKLSDVARNHSKDMALRNYFSHETPEGVDPTGRAESQRYKCEKIIGNLMYIGIAENIFQNNLYDVAWYTGEIPTSYEWNTQDEIALTTVDGWMGSPGHRKNILTETFDREGIGVEISSDDKVYITQNFC